jgi:alkylresorcinol/alkylpyrone synthase
VLEALRAAGRPRADRPAVVMAFGPGLTLYAALLRST